MKKKYCFIITVLFLFTSRFFLLAQNDDTSPFQAEMLFRIVHFSERGCLDVPMGNREAGALINISENFPIPPPHQEWQLILLPEGYFKIVAHHSGMCISIMEQKAEKGALLVQIPWNNKESQKWQIVLKENKYFKIIPKANSNLSITAEISSDDIQGNIVLKAIAGNDSQLWKIVPIMTIEQSEVIGEFRKQFEKALKLLHNNKKQEAADLVQKALKQVINYFAEDHPRIIMEKIDVIHLFLEAGQLAEAESLILDVLNIAASKEIGIPFYKICIVYHEYGRVLTLLNKYEKAANYFEKSIQLADELIATAISSFQKIKARRAKAVAIFGLALLNAELESYLEADNLFKQAIEILKRPDVLIPREIIKFLSIYRDYLEYQLKYREVEKIEEEIKHYKLLAKADKLEMYNPH